MTINELFIVCYHRGVGLLVEGDQLRARGKFGAVNEALRRGLAEHKTTLIAMLGDGIHPDPLLPDRVVYSSSVPNTIEAFDACYEAQRARVAA
jgi:hypothetical protein